MIRIRLARAVDGTPKRLTMSGHAEKAPYGEDIVCAAASALIETLVLGLNDVVGQAPTGTVEPGDADLIFYSPASKEARAVVETIVRGLKDLADTEPSAVSFEEQWNGQ